MIAPRSRLLFWVGAIVLPCALLAIAPELRLLAASLVGVFLLGTIIDAVLALSSLRGIEVLLPKVVRMSKDRASVLELQIKNTTQR